MNTTQANKGGALVAITSTAKGHRVWVQALESKGITTKVNDRFTVAFKGDTIVVTFGPEEKRKVTQAKGGIVDLVSSKVTQWAQGATEAVLAVNTEAQQLTLTRV